MALRNALQLVIVTENHELIATLCRRYPHELIQVIQVYNQLYQRDLYHDVKINVSGDYQHVLLGLLVVDPIRYDSYCLTHAMQHRVGTTDTCVIDILAARGNAEKATIKAAFQQEHSRSLESWISHETSGHYREFLLALLGPRDETNVINISQVQIDANRLYSAGEGRIGTDEGTFVQFFARSSLAHIKAVAAAYPTVNKKHHTLHKAIDSEFSLHLKQALLSVLLVAEEGVLIFNVDCCYKAMKGVGTNDSRLIRSILIAWHRLWIPQHKEIFQRKYGKSLRDWVISETSFNYRNALLAVIQEATYS